MNTSEVLKGFARRSPEERRAYGQLGGTIAQAMRDEGMANTHRWTAGSDEPRQAAYRAHHARKLNGLRKCGLIPDLAEEY